LLIHAFDISQKVDIYYVYYLINVGLFDFYWLGGLRRFELLENGSL